MRNSFGLWMALFTISIMNLSACLTRSPDLKDLGDVLIWFFISSVSGYSMSSLYVEAKRAAEENKKEVKK